MDGKQHRVYPKVSGRSLELERFFGDGTSAGKVTGLSPNLSDPHNRHRTVIVLEFESGLKLVYKPKDLGLEKSYAEFLAYLNSKSICLDLKIIKALAKDGYGWVEFIKHTPCTDPEEVHNFYKRSGMLLALLYALETTDCHYENIIASGEYPVLIDMETLFHHQPVVVRDEDSVNIDAQYLAGDQLWNSVLRTSYLPRWQFGLNGESYDLSGMGGGDPGRQTSFQRPEWRDINTDRMKLVYQKATIEQEKNMPVLDGEYISYHDYVSEFLSGFTEMYRLFIQNSDEIIKDGGPLERFKEQKVRYLFRNTRTYYDVQNKSFEVNQLIDGITRSLALEALSRAMVKHDQKPYFYGLLKKELQAMEIGDIPYFYSLTTGKDIYCAGEKVTAEFFEKTSYDNVVQRISGFNDQDLEKQLSIIKAALFSKVATDSHRLEESMLRFDPVNEIEVPEFTKELAVAKALEIAGELFQKAIVSPDGAYGWIGLNFNPIYDQYQLEPLGYTYYNGVGGVGIFLAALYKVTGDRIFQDYALGSVKNIREMIHKEKYLAGLLADLEVGGGYGSSSLVYALSKIGELLGQEDLIRDAAKIAYTFNEETVNKDRKYDVILGSAGAILSLSKLYELTHDAQVLAKAAIFGEHLLENRVVSHTGYRAWGNEGNYLLTGFSHGAAGIAYALIKLHQFTGDERFLDAGVDAMKYERSVFVKEECNWPDYRGIMDGGKNLRFGKSWCHGAPGIGLARIGVYQFLRDERVRQEIEIALDTTKNYAVDDIDHLCCGNLGRVETILTAGILFDDKRLQETAARKIAEVIAVSGQRGGYGLNWNEEPFNPAFFRGVTGIGYEFLRVAYPELLSSVLLWE